MEQLRSFIQTTQACDRGSGGSFCQVRGAPTTLAPDGDAYFGDVMCEAGQGPSRAVLFHRVVEPPPDTCGQFCRLEGVPWVVVRIRVVEPTGVLDLVTPRCR